MIGKRNILEPAAGHAFVERSPSAVAALEAEQPRERPVELPGMPGLVRVGREAQRHQHHRGVVGVGIKVVVIFKSPAARLRAGIVARPIPRAAHLPRAQPLDRSDKGGLIGRAAGFRQRDDVDGSVPDRREARLNPKVARVIDKQSLEVRARLFQ